MVACIELPILLRLRPYLMRGASALVWSMLLDLVQCGTLQSLCGFGDLQR